MITIEDSLELQLQGLPNLVRMETRTANVEGENRITITSGAPDLEVEGDIRKLNFKVIQMEILMGDEQMDLMNLLSRE